SCSPHRGREEEARRLLLHSALGDRTMAMSTTAGGGIKAEPNVTPMIDVMLVLLISFMIVVPALNAGFNALPPQGANLKAHPGDPGDQMLGIDAAGHYFLNKKPIRNDDLPTLLKTI